MSLAELLPSVQTLPRADRMRLAQFLIAELAREEGVEPLREGDSYPVWTPLGAYDAAAVMLQALNTPGEAV